MIRFHWSRKFARASAVPINLLLTLGAACLWTSAFAQSTSSGRTLFTTPQASGQPSCSNGGCHGPDPTTNQNRIRNGANNPTVIANAINTRVPVMAFLRGRLSASQLSDLAAYIANPGSINTAPVASLSSTTLGFGSVNVGSSSGVQAVTISNTGAGTLQLSSITVTGGEFVRSGGTCAVGTALAATTNCSIGVIFSPAATGLRTATLSIAHNAAGSPSTVSLAGAGAAASAATTTMVEFYFAALDYYFITSRANDIALLDTLTAWRRTGLSFKVFTSQQASAAGIDRYYFDQVAVGNTRGSHFYTLVQGEKNALAGLNPSNRQTPRLPYNEGLDSFAFAPAVEGVGGSCAAGLTPVYRIFRGQAKFPDNPNHRFTTDTAIYNAFVALGWDGEGVKFCVPN